MFFGNFCNFWQFSKEELLEKALTKKLEGIYYYYYYYYYYYS